LRTSSISKKINYKSTKELDEVKKSNRVKTLENYFGTNISEDLLEDFTK